MKKRCLAIVLTAAVMIGSIMTSGVAKVSANMVTGITNDGFRYEYDTNSISASVISYEGNNPVAQVPNTINGKKVTDVNITNNVVLTKLIIPSNVTNIVRNFESYDSKESQGYFRGCENLKEIVVDAQNTKYSAVDGMLLSKDKSILYTTVPALSGSISIPSTVKEINREAFYLSPNLTAYLVDNGNTMFSSKDGVLYRVNGQELFAYPQSKATKEFNVPEGCYLISTAAFFHSNLLERVKLSETVTFIDHEAFYECTNLHELETTGGLKGIYDRAFYRCFGLSKVSFCEGLSYVADGAFSSCRSLRSVDLPKSLYYSDGYAFPYKSLTNIVVRNSSLNLGLNYRLKESCKVTLPKQSVMYKKLKKKNFTITVLKDSGLLKNSKVKKIKTKKSVIKGKGKPSTSWYKKKAKKLYISSPDQLAGVGKLVRRGVTFKDKTIILKKNIDMSKYKNWQPIGTDLYGKIFNGTFNGNKKTIYNLTINRPYTAEVGLFTRIGSSATIKNVKLVSAKIIGDYNVGGIVGRARGKVINCSVKGNVVGNESVGGIAGITLFKGKINKCTNSAKVYANTISGGIVGISENCYANNLKDNNNKGSVSANFNAGGIVGELSAYTGNFIVNCKNSGKIKARRFVGGIAGYAWNNYRKETTTGLISDRGFMSCTNTGNVSATLKNGFVGGIAGMTIYSMDKCTSKTSQLSGGKWRMQVTY